MKNPCTGQPTIPMDDEFVIELGERITLGRGDVALLRSAERALSAGASQIVIRFSPTTRLDTFGINALITACQQVARTGATLTLLNTPRRVREILELAHRGSPRALAEVA